MAQIFVPVLNSDFLTSCDDPGVLMEAISLSQKDFPVAKALTFHADRPICRDAVAGADLTISPLPMCPADAIAIHSTMSMISRDGTTTYSLNLQPICSRADEDSNARNRMIGQFAVTGLASHKEYRGRIRRQPRDDHARRANTSRKRGRRFAQAAHAAQPDGD